MAQAKHEQEMKSVVVENGPINDCDYKGEDKAKVPFIRRQRTSTIISTDALTRTIQPEPKVNTEKEWKSCCMRVDPRMFVFFVQVIMSSALLAFAIVQTHYATDCCKGSVYIGMISSIVGYWLPQPTLR